MKIQIVAVLVLCFSMSSTASVSPLYERGYTVMPEPQKVILGPNDFVFGADWRVELGQGVNKSDVAIGALTEDLAARFQLKIGTRPAGAGTLRLVMRPRSVEPGSTQDRDKTAIAQQAYRVDLAPGRVTITANAPAGLFYGVETFVQLLKPRNGTFWLPEGRIEDWPDLQLRQIYWDDAHHLEKPEALKKAIRQAAFFKINGFVLKLEGHFQFKSAPAVVEPYALSPAEYQDLTDYGLKYHVQVVPYLDGPAHIAFILKHPEYAKLREYPDSNYELCATNPDSYKLMSGMFQDLIDANRGVKYFYLSTDEPYYVGMADNAQCQEGVRAKELGSVGKVFAEFVTKTAHYLRNQGRTVLFWGEFPLKPEDLTALPSDVVNAETYGPPFDVVFKKQGIREMFYTSTEGSEQLFPDYFSLPASRHLHPGARTSQRVMDTFRKISYDTARRDADLMGETNAGWADMGLHPEVFWLGYATSGSTGWHPGSPDPRESMSTFYTLYYGSGVRSMDRIYQLMSQQAQFWVDSWDTVSSTARKGIWGYSEGIFDKPHPAHEQTIPLPPAPGADLSYQSDWAQSNARRMQLVDDSLAENGELFGLLHDNFQQVQLNRHNLAVFLSIAGLYRQNLEMLRAIAQIDSLLNSAAAAKTHLRQAMQSMDRALDAAQSIQWARNRALRDAQQVWYTTWYPRVEQANGRRFLHELDDVKDHLPDRTVDMSYLVYREMQLPFNQWVEQIRTARNQYAAAHQLPRRNDHFDWLDLKPVSGSEVGAISLE